MTMRQTNFLLLSTLLLVFTTTFSCVDQLTDIQDSDDNRFEAEYALPLVNSKITMADILEDFEEDAVLTVDPNGLLRFQYSGDVLTQSSMDVFAVIEESIAGLGFFPLSQRRQALPLPAIQDLVLDRLQMKNTTLAYAFANDRDFPVTMTLTLPTVLLDGVPFSYTEELPAWDGNGDPVSSNNLNDPFDLTGWDLTLEDDSIFIEVSTVDAAGIEYDPTPGTAMKFENFSFTYAQGFLGTEPYEGGRDTIEIDFFDNWIRGDVYFEDPVITFNFENSFGVPTEAVINVFNIITAEGDTLPLESEFITDGGIEFPYPELDEVGETKSTQFVFDKNNSNIDVVLGSKPVAIDYDVDALTNPDTSEQIIGFITDSSFYRVLVDVDLPLFGQAANFEVRDTFELDLSEYGDDVESIEWKLVTENGLPLGVEIQGDFLDAEGNLIATLFEEGEEPVIGGAPVDGEGRPTAKNEVVTFINWDASELDTVIKAQRLLLTAVFSTTLELEQSVQLLSDQELEIRIGAIIKVTD
ncbi:hypothetical protein CEQ90_08290 [Lewinellaceae bacterium SD302]|nr:hypothetical protein CEQ90_08290 [Lewinellaceae bacterium SD302]